MKIIHFAGSAIIVLILLSGCTTNQQQKSSGFTNVAREAEVTNSGGIKDSNYLSTQIPGGGMWANGKRFMELFMQLGYPQDEAMFEAFTRMSSGLAEMGGGVAWADVNGDNLPDLYVTNSNRPPWSPLMKELARAHEETLPEFPPVNAKNKLYLNNGDGTFREVAEQAGVAIAAYSMGAVFADYDNDGRQDLFVAQFATPPVSQNNIWGETNIDIAEYITSGSIVRTENKIPYISNDRELTNKLFHNDGNDKNGIPQFRDVTESAGLARLGKSQSATWCDYDRDGLLDLAVANWGEGNNLYHNNGNGTFTDVAIALKVDRSQETHHVLYPRKEREMDYRPIAKPTFVFYCGDINDDLWPDLVHISDQGNSVTFLNNGDGTFRDVTTSAHLSAGGDWMGIATGDVDADGDTDMYWSDWGPNTLWIQQKENGTSVFEQNGGYAEPNKTISGFIEGLTDGGVSWGVAMFDYDLDGLLDIAVANSSIRPMDVNTVNENADTLLKNLGDNKWKNVTQEQNVFNESLTKGLAVADYNNDGLPDYYVYSANTNSYLFRNDNHNGNHYLKIKLIGTESNRDAIGARITISQNGKTQYRIIDGGSSFLSQNDKEALFGLGRNDSIVHIKIEWPSGTITEHTSNVDHQIIITENNV